MPPHAAAAKKKKKSKKSKVEEELSENLQDDDELLMEANQMGIDKEDLTPEQMDKTHYKKLTSNNPQAPKNITKFSYKERYFKTDEDVDQIVFHYCNDGDILVAESDEARDQDDYLENKRQSDKKLLAKMNSRYLEVFGADEGKSVASVTAQFHRRQRRRKAEEVPPQPVLLPRAHLADLQPAHPRARHEDRPAQDVDLRRRDHPVDGL